MPLTDAAVDRVLLGIARMARSRRRCASLAVLAAGRGCSWSSEPARSVGALWIRDRSAMAPYSRSQITQFCARPGSRPQWAKHSMCHRSRAAVPALRRWRGRGGSAVAAPFAGVHIVEATSRSIGPFGAPRARAWCLALEPALAPSHRG